MTNQMAIGFVTPDELHEMCQGIGDRIARLFDLRAEAVKFGNADNVKYWTECIDASKEAQRKLLAAYQV